MIAAADGSFTVTFTVPPVGRDLAVYVSKAHGVGVADPSEDVVVPVVYAAPVPGGEGDDDGAGGGPGEDGDDGTDGGSGDGGSDDGTGGGGSGDGTGDDGWDGGQEAAPVWTPSIELFVRSGASLVPLGDRTVTDGDVVVVRGAGFDPAANVGGYGNPIPSTLPQGTYLVFGAFADVWRPSEGATSAARKIGSQLWVLDRATLDQVPASGRNAILPSWVELAADGTFTAELTVKAPAETEGRTLAVATYAAGGTKNAAQELFVPVRYAAPAPAPEPEPEPEPGPGPAPTPTGPTLTVSPTTGLVAGRDETVTIRGTGFAAARSRDGLYVNIGTADYWTPGTRPSVDGWTASAFLPAGLIAADGSFTTTLTVRAGAAKVGVDHVATAFCAHGCAFTDRSLDAVSAAFRFAAAAPGGTTGGGSDRPALVTTGGGTATPAQGDVLRPGTAVTFTASGFRPHETGIRLELHSDPVVLATDLTADANGVVRYTVTLPAGTPPGAHTLVVIGAEHVARIPVTVAAPLPVCEARVVSGATLTWGVKAAFREYVTGSVAHGSVSTSGVSGSGPFTWTGGSGTYNTADRVGGAAFGGSVRFTGHGGALDVTVSDLRVQVAAGGAQGTLYGTIRTGDTTRANVAVATLALSSGSASTSGGQVRWTGVPARLTSSAASSFEGFYSAGEAMDPVSFTLPLGATTACTSASGANLARYGGSLAATGADATGAFLALALVLVGGGLVATGRRVRRAR